MNHVTLLGNLGHDLEIKRTGNTTYVSFSIATEERWTDRDGGRQSRTDWHRVVAFNGLAAALNPLQKGDRVLVQGKIRSRTYEVEDQRRTAIEIHAASVEFVKVKAWAAGRKDEAAQTEGGSSAPAVPGEFSGPDDDDIPF